MIKITDTIQLNNVRPEECWEFLTTVHEGSNYLKWHPIDHRWLKLLSGDGKSIGSKLRFEEVIGGKSLRMSYQVTSLKQPHYIEYGATFPLSLLKIARQSFSMRKIEDGTEFTAELTLGYNIPFLDLVIDTLLYKIVHIKLIKKHIKEEGIYMHQELTKNRKRSKSQSSHI